MKPAHDAYSWFGPSRALATQDLEDERPEFDRLWLGFMTARVMLSVVLLILQGTLFWLGQLPSTGLTVVCGIYFAAALLVRLGATPRQLGRTFELQWLYTIGADVAVFSVLQFMQVGSINYTPLFALPVMLAAILGTLRLALGTAASITLLLLAHEAWLSLQFFGDVTPHFIQAGLTGIGSFVIAILAHQLAARLANQEQRAKRNQLAANIQQQVNELVIESLSDGVLVLDSYGMVHALNPAARHMLQLDDQLVPDTPFPLASNPGWQPLGQLTQQVFSEQHSPPTEIALQTAGQGVLHLRVRTQLTTLQGHGSAGLCVMFVQDQREMEARLRTEKLASMGRMSAAVAHEIRNPLAAITQANALLDEDLHNPQHKQLTSIVQQNAKRLEKIVEEILDIARVKHQLPTHEPMTLDLNDAVLRICNDWATQTQSQERLILKPAPRRLEVDFEFEHLRRVLVNLLDNARRYASKQAESIQVSTRCAINGQAVLGVWSDSPPMEASVERHLFEPFFSSESRSSGLGLYICRELCAGHGASIVHQRSMIRMRDMLIEGNEFVIDFFLPPLVNDSTTNSRPLFVPWR